MPPPKPAAAIVIAAAIFTGPFPGAKCHGHFSNGYLSGREKAQPGDEHLRAIGPMIPNELSMKLQHSIVFGTSVGSLTCDQVGRPLQWAPHSRRRIASDYGKERVSNLRTYSAPAQMELRISRSSRNYSYFVANGGRTIRSTQLASTFFASALSRNPIAIRSIQPGSVRPSTP